MAQTRHAAPASQRISEPVKPPRVRRTEPADITFDRDASNTLIVNLSGNWQLLPNLPSPDLLTQEIDAETTPSRIAFNVADLGFWDSGLVSFVLRCREICQRRRLSFSEDALPDGIRKLLRLATAVPETTDAKREATKSSLLNRLGEWGLQMSSASAEIAEFLGNSIVALLRLMRGKAQFRAVDVLQVMQQCGPQALSVVALINFLVGVILAFVGAVQLRQFGASIYVADLVAIGTVREMGCIMTGVILCGRTGAAFAAELGAMKVNEEIAAFRTFGISPLEFLVLPRMVGLFLMMPLLCVFADFIAIAGGYLVSTSMLDLTTTEYLRRTIEAITLKSFLLGIFKGAVFGVIVAVSGCLRGMQCGANAAAVGQATTSAVVTGITTIVAADGVFAVLCNALNI